MADATSGQQINGVHKNGQNCLPVNTCRPDIQQDTEVNNICAQARLRGYTGCKRILYEFHIAATHGVQPVSTCVMHKLAVIKADAVCMSNQLLSLHSIESAQACASSH